MTLYYGFDRELVQSAVFHDLIQMTSKMHLLPTEGKYVKKNEAIYFQAKLNPGEELEFPCGSDMSDEDFQSFNSKFAVHAILSFKEKNRDRYQVVTCSGDTEKEAEEGLDEMIFNTYINFHKLRSKKKVEELVNKFLSDFSKMSSS